MGSSSEPKSLLRAHGRVSGTHTYPSDLSDARWALIAPTLHTWRQARLDRRPTGQPAQVELREIFNAILYVNRTGIAWKYLPHDFPPHGTVYFYFAAWRDEGIFAQLNYDLTGLARAKAGRTPEPTACILDTQSVKTSTNVSLTSQGTDASKKIVGRKRGIVTDTLGLILAVTVTAAPSFPWNRGGDRLGQGRVSVWWLWVGVPGAARLMGQVPTWPCLSWPRGRRGSGVRDGPEGHRRQAAAERFRMLDGRIAVTVLRPLPSRATPA